MTPFGDFSHSIFFVRTSFIHMSATVRYASFVAYRSSHIKHTLDEFHRWLRFGCCLYILECKLIKEAEPYSCSRLCRTFLAYFFPILLLLIRVIDKSKLAKYKHLFFSHDKNWVKQFADAAITRFSRIYTFVHVQLNRFLVEWKLNKIIAALKIVFLIVVSFLLLQFYLL